MATVGAVRPKPPPQYAKFVTQNEDVVAAGATIPSQRQLLGFKRLFEWFRSKVR